MGFNSVLKGLNEHKFVPVHKNKARNKNGGEYVVISRIGLFFFEPILFSRMLLKDSINW